MTEQFFEKPILNSPYRYPARHWELDKDGQPTHQIIETRRPADFVSPAWVRRANGARTTPGYKGSTPPGFASECV